jgi:hypothetical protein
VTKLLFDKSVKKQNAKEVASGEHQKSYKQGIQPCLGAIALLRGSAYFLSSGRYDPVIPAANRALGSARLLES